MSYSKVKRLRDRAEEARIRGEASPYPSAKAIWDDIAESYETIAGEWEELGLTKALIETHPQG
jgi:type IV secretory pathway TrbF-like protein